MHGHFRRTLPKRRLERRPHGSLVPPGRDPSLAVLIATMLLFDRDPSTMVTQVRAWLAEDEDRG
jgi:hypothetical protein